MIRIISIIFGISIFIMAILSIGYKMGYANGQHDVQLKVIENHMNN